MTHGEEWFWGAPLTDEEKAAHLEQFDRVLQVEGALACMIYDWRPRVATLHIILEESFRNGKNVGKLIASAVEMAREDGMRKIVAPLLGNSPFLKPNRDRKFGFVREGILREHAFVWGEFQDVHIYAMFLT